MSSESATHRLIVEQGPDAGKVFVIDQPVVSIGRSVSNTFQVVDRRMSRNHCEVHVTGGRIILRDLGSKNGTLHNGVQVNGSIPMVPGDRITIGDTVLLLEAEEIPGAPRPAGSGDSHEGAATMVGVPRDPSGSQSSSGFRLVEENQWGRAKGSMRAGYDPTASPAALKPTSAEELRDVSRRLQLLYEVAEAIRSIFTLDELLDRIMEIVHSLMRPDRAYLLLLNQNTGEFEPAIVKSADTLTDQKEIPISKSIAARCLNEGVSILVSDAAADERFNAAESIIMNRIRTAMVAPMLFKTERLGVIYIDTQSRALAFTNEELEMLTSIANQAAVAIINARMHQQLVEQHKLAREMEIARAIQMNLLPKTYPDVPGYQLSAMSLPAKQVGGDYYDFLRLPDSRLGLAIADVSGKGVSAAILTATTRSYVQSETQHKDVSILGAIERINRMVARDVSGGSMYVTMVLAALDPTEGLIEYVNAGHAYPVLLSPNGQVTFLKAGGVFLGIAEDPSFTVGEVRIPPGGVLIMFTDGVTDVLDPAGQAFGADRFLELLRDKVHLGAEEIRNAIYNACLRHRGTADQFDDLTLLVLKRLDFNESEMD